MILPYLDVGMTNQRRSMKKIDQIEDNKKILFSDWTGIIISFKISFTPSINGWAEPFIPTLFGPLLL